MTFKSTCTAGLLATTLAFTPQAAPAGSTDAVRCADRGGRWVSGKCDTSPPPTMDLFGWIITGVLVSIALGLGAPSK